MSEFTGISINSTQALEKLSVMSFLCDVESLPDGQHPDVRQYVDGALVPNLSTARHCPDKDALLPFLATDETPDSGKIELITGETARFAKFLEIYRQRQKKRQTICPPNQVTTTINYQEPGEKFEGLHFDNANDLSLIQPLGSSPRLKSPRRIGMNYGPGSRVLWLTSVDVFDIARAGIEADSTFVPVADHLREYHRKYAETERAIKVLGVIVPRLRGYIAGSELTGHDGGTPNLDEIIDPTRLPEDIRITTEQSTVQFYLGSWTVGTFGSILNS